MFLAETIEENSVSLINLLAEQCHDLEKLLQLARQETQAIEREDFGKVLQIVSERATLGQKLEVFQKQIGEMRERLGERAEFILRDSVAERMRDLAVKIISQDADSEPLLRAAQQEASSKLAKLDKSQQHVSLYARENLKGLSYDKTF